MIIHEWKNCAKPVIFLSSVIKNMYRHIMACQVKNLFNEDIEAKLIFISKALYSPLLGREEGFGIL